MVTSAAPGEGKSFTSINLALGLAEELDWLVILVDADVAKQHLTAVLGLQGESGLLDALSDTQASLADVVHRTSSPKLMFVPAGRQSAESNELLSSSRMQFLLEQLARDFPRSIVLLDSPPLLDTNEARALIDVAGQVLLVVRADVTPRALVQQAVEVLGTERPVSLILNGAQRSSVGSYYYYGEPPEHAAAR
jgi:receptor protein-tyrosine kinase